MAERLRPVRFRPEARRELREATDWYGERRPDLSDAFRDEVRRPVAEIRANPGAYVVVHRGVRRGLTRRFPYKVFLRETSGTIEVIAVRHQSRRPLGIE